MATQRVGAVASAVTLTLATEVAVVTLTCAPPNNQVSAGATVQLMATVVVTGAASATTCTLKLRRGSGLAGTDILPTDVVLTVAASAIDEGVTIVVQETAANFNAANGIYTLTANAAGAAQSARMASLECQVLASGV